MKNRLTLLIHSCGAYSDLWDGQVKQLNEHWKDRNIDTYILTDNNPEKKSYDGVTIIETGAGTEITERVHSFLKICKTEYIFVTLDDYYLIQDVSSDRIKYLIEIMDERDVDYIRIFRLPSDGAPVDGTDHLNYINLFEDKSKYYVNLYPGVWRTSFMEKTIREKLNAWQYEVSLTPIARECGAVCLVDRQDDYVLLDVVRKGKLLHKAVKYFKNHPGIYNGDRKVISLFLEGKLFIIQVIQRLLHKKTQYRIKRILKKMGMHFFSE